MSPNLRLAGRPPLLVFIKRAPRGKLRGRKERSSKIMIRPRRLSNVVGFDDAPFAKAHRGNVKVVGAVFARERLDGVLVGQVRRDGANTAPTTFTLPRCALAKGASSKPTTLEKRLGRVITFDEPRNGS